MLSFLYVDFALRSTQELFSFLYNFRKLVIANEKGIYKPTTVQQQDPTATILVPHRTKEGWFAWKHEQGAARTA